MSEWDPNFTDKPGTLILGKQRDGWPLHLFVSDVHALDWMSEQPRNRQLWRVSVTVLEELGYVPPGPPRLEPMTKMGGGA